MSTTMTREDLLAMKASGNTWIRIDGREFRWPFCLVEGCTNRACLRLMSVYCHPHTDVGGLLRDLESAEPIPGFDLPEKVLA